jgi:hypothetical protein
MGKDGGLSRYFKGFAAFPWILERNPPTEGGAIVPKLDAFIVRK